MFRFVKKLPSICINQECSMGVGVPWAYAFSSHLNINGPQCLGFLKECPFSYVDKISGERTSQKLLYKYLLATFWVFTVCFYCFAIYALFTDRV